jgi:hypothetical protein
MLTVALVARGGVGYKQVEEGGETHLRMPPLAPASTATRIGTGIKARKVAPQMA